MATPTTAQYIAALLALYDLDPKTKLPVRLKKTSLPDADDQYKADLKAWLSDGTTTSPAPTPSPVAVGELLPAAFPKAFSLHGTEQQRGVVTLAAGASYVLTVEASDITKQDGGLGVGFRAVGASGGFGYTKLTNGKQTIDFRAIPVGGSWEFYTQGNGGSGKVLSISLQQVG